jgi:serine phosphatase RsbU (regulator of sigma subunit)
MKTSTRWLLSMVGGFSAALAVSGWLYARSRSADFDRHARAVEGIGRVRHASGQLAAQVLASRFGLLNQYDPITATEANLDVADAELGSLLAGTVEVDPELERAVKSLGEAVAQQLAGAERFKADNSVLKNSLFYLPSAAREASQRPETKAARPNPAAAAIQATLEAALVYNLVGDRTARATYERKLADLVKVSALGAARPELSRFSAHARVIADKQPVVDRWMKQVVESEVEAKLSVVERGYEQRFKHTVDESSRYRKYLYGWTLVLLAMVVGAGIQLRRLYAGLERRVAERTAELSSALSALWGEMRLARKIQEALVPNAPMLDGCEVAASMRPTDDVGGDYYDVVRGEKHDWILIGDVSGHGVPAGLVMMMCHTAVRTLLHAEPDITPSRLLSAVNEVLTQNIRQLGENKYMTLSAFRRDRDGSVHFAGAHQDVFVYRAYNGSVETLETSGLWLGIRPGIDSTLRTRELRLGDDDVLVLFTDGITEATRDGALFDNAGVGRVLARAGGKSARQVLEDVFSELSGYQVNDDATLLVVRQLPKVQSPARVAG